MRLWLERDEVLCLPRVPRGLTVRCERGSAWLTQRGNPGDHLLGAGGALRLAGRGRVAVWAGEPCLLRLEGANGRRAVALRWQGERAAALG